MKVFIIFLIFASFKVLSNELNIEVNLSPAGSFEAKTIKVIGKILSTKTGYSADKLSIQIDDLVTGIDLRNEHLRKYLKSGKKLNSIIFTRVTAINNLCTGTLTLNGINKIITFSYVFFG